MPTVSFAREGIRVDVEHGQTIREAAQRADIRLYTGIFRLINCFGFGMCGECRVLVTDGMDRLGGVTEGERTFKRPRQDRSLGTFGIYETRGERLPCQAKVLGDVTVWTRPRDGTPT